MTRTVVAVLLAISLVGCAAGAVSPGASSPDAGSSSASASPTEDVASPTAEASASDTPGPSADADDWNRSAETPTYNLCPPDAQATDAPVFGPPVEATFGEFPGVVEHGVVANKEGELFRMDVTGRDAESVDAYTKPDPNDYPDGLRVCFDHILTGNVAEDEAGPASEEVPAPAPFGSNAGDLLIEVYILGFLDASDPALAEVAAQLARRDIANWNDLLVERRATPDIALEGRTDQDWILDFVVDPRVGEGATHQYAERKATKALAALSLMDGRLRAGLCRNAVTASTFSTKPVKTLQLGVGAGGLPAGQISLTATSEYRYDLGVRGLSSSRYRVAGSWGYASWVAGYWDPVPPGSVKYCYP